MSLKPVELLSHDYLINHISMQYNRDKEKEFFIIMLTGNQLIQTIQNNSDLSKSDLLRVTGYTSVRKDGSIKLNFTAFYQALINIK